MSVDRVLALLKQDFGLSDYESSVVRALKSKKLSADEVMAKTGIPQGRIYSVLGELLEKSLIHVEASAVSKYFIEDFDKTVFDFVDKVYSDDFDRQKELIGTFAKEKSTFNVREFKSMKELVEVDQKVRDEAAFVLTTSWLGYYTTLFFGEDPKSIFDLKKKVLRELDLPFLTSKSESVETKRLEESVKRMKTQQVTIVMGQDNVELFVNTLTKVLGKKKAKIHLVELIARLKRYPSLKVRVTSRAFEERLLVTDKAVLIKYLATPEPKGSQLAGVMLTGSDVVKSYVRVFNQTYDKTVSVERELKRLTGGLA